MFSLVYSAPYSLEDMNVQKIFRQDTTLNEEVECNYRTRCNDHEAACGGSRYLSIKGTYPGLDL